jgi:hypothetical protein
LNSDYRKLTFFYYAEEYINFNELVTDLFKVYKTRIWMSAINPSTYMAMNPNTAPRAPHAHRPTGAANHGHAASYLRTQEDYRTTLESGRTASPIDRDGPAARGNREYERVLQMQNQPRMGPRPNDVPPPASGGLSDGELNFEYNSFPTLTCEDFPTGMQPFYDPRRAQPNPAFASGQFAAFAHQYGPNGTANAWPQNGAPGGYPFMFPNARENMNTPNYAVSPIGGIPPSAINQQAAVFTPRAAMPQQQQQQYATNGGYDEAGMHKLLNEQFRSFQIDATRRG